MSGGQRLALWCFQRLIGLLVPVFLLRLWWRGRRQPGYRAHWRERLGWYPVNALPAAGPASAAEPAAAAAPAPRPRRGAIWLHAVSVGETRACVPLVAALRARDPGCAILLTHMTPTGRATGRDLFGDSVDQCYLPWDTPGAVARFLDHFQPALGLLMETELWPTLIHTCAARGVPLWLVNARLSARSARGYARLPALVQPALAALAGVCAQSVADAERLQAIGAPPGAVTVTGNVKFDAPLPADEAQQAQALRTALRTAPDAPRGVWLAASTREGEEALLMDALLRAQTSVHDGAATQAPVQGSAVVPPLLVLVPRHPQRFDEVAQMLEARGLSYVRRSQWSGASGQPLPADVRVVLGDTMGELGLWYGAVDLAWIGGSLLPLGGQNLLEACARGCPVLLGPHMFNFAAASAEALVSGAALQVTDAGHLITQVEQLLSDAPQRARMGAAGRAFVAAHRGAAVRTLQALGRDCGVAEADG